MTYTLKPLPYAYDALEPFIDEQTVRIHHDKHHQAYVDNLNKAVSGNPELEKLSPEELIRNLAKIPKNLRVAVRNYGGGVWNHDFFWESLANLKKKEARTGEVNVPGTILKAIERRYGSFESFKEEFTTASLGLFGSGWVWLVLERGELQIITTTNQDSPIHDDKIPLLCNDLWEHAYYLKYQNKRGEYVANFFNVIDWRMVEKRYLRR